ncbi:NERD domain-containing protein [Nocardia amamiensis]|uniref:NERD domain-containing protein n=1 Tax=Nocardia amamiensis TaxID=404578 RepID=A0ABS0CSZ5_9NOCA|nr:nuclease-related domain-containing protein [Nocardia amamiensis]MBF6299426.1 NERD domain-containing protein [Nocardia amamiensis]
MLVINERTTAPRSEQRVLDWMRSWTGQYVIVGLAISGCYLPIRCRTGEAQEADLVVITPRAAVVIEVKGTVPDAMTGVLSVQANGRWRLSGFEGDPVHVRDHDSSPFDQVTNNVFNLKELVRKHHSEAYVDGLIVVVPPRESTVTLNIESRRKGCGVVLGNTPVELRAWFHRTASRKLIWTAERVHALLGDLNLADQVSIEELVADGFPLERTLPGETGAVVLEDAAAVEGLPSAGNSDAVGAPTDADARSSHSALDQPDVVPTAVGGTSSVEDSDAVGVVTDVDVPSSHSTLDRPDVVPTAVGGTSSVEDSDAVGVVTDVDVPSSHSTLDRPDVVPAAVGGTSSVEDSDAVSVATDVDAPSSHSILDQLDTVPIAPALNASGAMQSARDDLGNEAAVASDLPTSQLTATHMRARADTSRLVASDAAGDPGLQDRQHTQYSPSIADRQSFDTLDEPEDDEAEPISRPHHFDGLLARRYAQTQRAESDPYAPEPFASGPVTPEPPPSDATPDFTAQSATPLSSPFTDRWSSWIESDAQPLRPRPTPPPLPNRPQWLSDEETEARPPRRPTPPRLVERRPRIPDLRQMITVPPRTRTPDQPRPIRHRPQQIAAVALIALVIGTIWLLAAACSTPHGDAVQQTPLPLSTTEPSPTTEVVPPPPTLTETPARFDLLPLCLPFRSDC